MNETKLTDWMESDNADWWTGGVGPTPLGYCYFRFLLKVRSRVWLDLHKEEKVSFETSRSFYFLFNLTIRLRSG